MLSLRKVLSGIGQPLQHLSAKRMGQGPENRIEIDHGSARSAQYAGVIDCGDTSDCVEDFNVANELAYGFQYAGGIQAI